MSGIGPTVAAYRAILRMYPSHFRDEYGADMVALFSAQLSDEGAARVCARTAVDLALTVPARHLEARMDRPPSHLVSLIFASLAVAGLLVAVIAGSNLETVAVALSVAVAAAGLAVVDRRRNAPLTAPPTARWWKLLAAGGALLAAIVVITTITGEGSYATWLLTMVAIAGAVVMLAAGAILGVARLAERRSPV